MGVRRYFIYFTAIYFGWVLLAHSQPSAQKILILNSYHPSFSWTHEIMRGIYSELGNDPRFTIHVSFMDCKRFSGDSYLNALHDLYKVKYADRHFGVILTSDENAFQFAMKYRKELFSDAPIVFCGLSVNHKEELLPQDHFTGVMEIPDLADTVELALRVRPHPRQIVLVYNGTDNDLLYREVVVSSLKNQFPLVEWKRKTTEEVIGRLADLTEQDIVLFLSFPQNWLDAMAKDDTLVRQCRALSFVSWDTLSGHGILGGKMVSGYFQGKIAAGMAKRVLAGEPAGSIPIRWDSPNQIVIDYPTLIKHGLKESDFPPDTNLINKPVTLYSQYRAWIWFWTFSLVVETVLIFLILINIIRRKRAEKSMRETQERFSLAVTAANEGIWDFDTQTSTVNYYSPKWYTMLGYDPYEMPMEYETWERLIHPDDKAPAERKIWNSIHHGDNYSVEFRMRTKSGEYRWILSTGKVVSQDAQGNPTRMVGTHVDITDFKKLEEQLMHSQKMESIGQLAGGIAHDFNNLLTAIVGYCDLSLILEVGESPVKQYLSEIHKAAARATTLTNQLLAFSRKQILDPKNINLSNLILNMERMLRRLIGENIEYTTLIDSYLGCVFADPGQMEQVVMNLVVNARDAMPLGGRLTLELRNVELEEYFVRSHIDAKAGSYILLAVSDTGIGMDESIRHRIFEPFFTTKEKGKGTGLGLSMVYGIIKQSGGFITVYSEPGCGTTFKIYLPQTGEPVEFMDGMESEALDDLDGSETVLLVEDDELVRSFVLDSLRQKGYTVHDCASGLQALQVFDQYSGSIDLLITDVVLPRMSGRVLAETVMKKWPEIKVIYMSGYTDSAIVKHGILEEGIHFLQKPFNPNDLYRKVRLVLENDKF